MCIEEKGHLNQSGQVSWYKGTISELTGGKEQGLSGRPAEECWF